MNIVCAICQDGLEPSNDIFTTPCGHAFHFPCLIQWLENAQNCPQCRQKVKRDRIIRLYFNFANSEAIKEDSFSLQSKIDSLSFQIKLKEAELKTSREETTRLKRQNQGLREEFKSAEKKITEQSSVIRAYKDQISYQQEKYRNYDRLRQENESLKKKIENYENVKKLLADTSEEVDRMVQNTQDVHSLATYISIMKRELHIGMNKRKELRNENKRLQSELQNAKMQRNEKQSENDVYLRMIKDLEEQLVITKTEKESLEKHISDKSDSVIEGKDLPAEKKTEASQSINSRKREIDLNFDIGAVLSKKAKKSVNDDDPFDLSFSFERSNNSDVIVVSPEKTKSKENEENSPYLLTKTKSILSFKDRTKSLTIRPKKSIPSFSKFRLSEKSPAQGDNAIQFDGLGGHSKTDIFPLPKSSPNKLKRSMSDSSKNKRVKLDLGSSKPMSSTKLMDDFVINLT